MRYKILKNGVEINVIVAEESFVSDYCSKNGYAYEEAPLPVPEPEPDPEPTPSSPTTEDRVAALESENKTLKAQVSAQSEQMDFYEECIAEMASVVYA